MRQSPLKQKTPLRAKSQLRSRAKPKRQPKPKVTVLRDKADKLVAHAIRLRDSEYIDGAWQGQCITCERICTVIDANGKWQKSNGWGHYIGRGNKFLRYWPENVNLQCSHCNAWRDKASMIDAYRLALDYKYGSGTYKKLDRMAREEDGFRLTVGYLQQVIEDATAELAFYEKSPAGLL